EAVKLVSPYKIGPLFTPPVLSKAEGPLATIMSPGEQGGTNWPGGSFDPETHFVYVFSRRETSILGLIPPGDPKISDMDMVRGRAGVGAQRGGRAMGGAPIPGGPGRGGRGGEGGGFAGGEAPARGLTVRGLPLLKPPYGTITAI